VSAPWATVVVPVYNTERWLDAALASIDRQPRRADLEVIVVDDGSTDSSATIAQAYAARSPRTRYVRQSNAGLGAARNHGVRLATGRYLAFLDSDDLYSPEGLHHLLTVAEGTDADIAVGDMHGFPPRPSPPWRCEIVGPGRTISSVAEAPNLVGNPSACNKVFRRDFVTAVGVRFTEGSAFEDVLFTVPLLLRSTRTVLTPQVAYLYRQRGNGSSIMDSRGQPAKIMQHLDIIERLMVDLDQIDEGSRRAVRRWMVYMQLHYAWRAAQNLNDQQLDEFTRRMSALLKPVPVPIVGEFVRTPIAGLRALALYERQTAAVREPRHDGQFRVIAGQLYLDHPALDRYRELLRVPDPRVTVDSVGRCGPTGGEVTTAQEPIIAREPVVLTGGCAVPGPHGAAVGVRTDLLLEIGDTLVREPLTIIGGTASELRWQARLDLSGIPTGRHRLRIIARDRGAELPLPPAPGAPGTRATLTRRGRAVWVAPGRRSLHLVVANPVTATAAAPWRLTRFARQRARRLARRGVWMARRGRDLARRFRSG